MRLVSRILLGIVTSIVPVFIAACYGIAYSFHQRGKVIDKSSKAPVQGLRVDCRGAQDRVADTTLTSADGVFDLHAEDSSACATVVVQDERNQTTHYATVSTPSTPGKDLVIEVAP